jgi:hypothetical protein
MPYFNPESIHAQSLAGTKAAASQMVLVIGSKSIELAIVACT